MGFETPELPKSKQDIINEKIMQAEKIQSDIDNLLDQMPEGELKTALQAKIKDLNKLWEEITELVAQEDEHDIKKD